MSPFRCDLGVVCGELTGNRYMQGFKCKVTGATSTKTLAKAQIPVYCEDDQSKCVKGAKQMLAWHQKTGNNIETERGTTPNYNQKCGWTEGAQTDIFEGAAVPSSTVSTVASSSVMAVSSTPAATPTTLATMVASSSVVVREYSSTSAPVHSTAAPVESKPCTKRQPRVSARAAQFAQ